MHADTEEQQIVHAVSGIFTALSGEDAAKFDSVTSPDFYVFEGGAPLNRDAIMGIIKAQHAAGKRYEWNVPTRTFTSMERPLGLLIPTRGALLTTLGPQTRIGWNLPSWKNEQTIGRLSLCIALVFL
jgi:hypothetical protein